jgi:hypothetical protein
MGEHIEMVDKFFSATDLLGDAENEPSTGSQIGRPLAAKRPNALLRDHRLDRSIPPYLSTHSLCVFHRRQDELPNNSLGAGGISLMMSLLTLRLQQY